MIISKEVDVKVGSLTYKYYKDLGYNVIKCGDIIKVKVKDLTKGSHTIIDVECDYCGKILHIAYKAYINHTSVINKCSCNNIECSNKKIIDVCMIKYNIVNPFQSETVKQKSKETLMKKHGVEHQMQLQSTKDKIIDTCLKKYGETSYTKTYEYLQKCKETSIKNCGVEHDAKTIEGKEKRKKTRIEKGDQIPDELLSEFTIYKKKVKNLTNLILKELYMNWDGVDYYDNEDIRINLTYGPNKSESVSVDHKISTYYGFKNSILPEDIAQLSNLCLTKLYINVNKGKLTEEEYYEKLRKNSI